MKKMSFIILAIPFLLAQCGKQKSNKPLASNFFQQASLEAQHGNPKKALNLVNKSIEYKSSPKSLLLKATLLHTINAPTESVTLFKKIINDKKTPAAMKADALNNYASALYDLKEYDQAEHIWEELCYDKDYLSPELAYFNLAIFQLKKALMLTLDSKDYFHHLNLSERYLHQALATSKYYIDAFFYLAQIHIRRNNLRLAHKTLMELLMEAPDHEVSQKLLLEIEKRLEKEKNPS